jgi:hypothetical protein
LEIYGLSKALSSISYLLKTTEIHVLSDNLGVCSFNSKLVCQNGRQRRCMAMLQNFNLTMHFVSGKMMASSDYLSRLPGFLTPGELVNWSPPKDEREIDDVLFTVAENETNTKIMPSYAAVVKRPANNCAKAKMTHCLDSFQRTNQTTQIQGCTSAREFNLFKLAPCQPRATQYLHDLIRFNSFLSIAVVNPSVCYIREPCKSGDSYRRPLPLIGQRV